MWKSFIINYLLQILNPYAGMSKMSPIYTDFNKISRLITQYILKIHITAKKHIRIHRPLRVIGT
jgi:hypothetical protein